jgi:hypothetical protein
MRLCPCTVPLEHCLERPRVFIAMPVRPGSGLSEEPACSGRGDPKHGPLSLSPNPPAPPSQTHTFRFRHRCWT